MSKFARKNKFKAHTQSPGLLLLIMWRGPFLHCKIKKVQFLASSKMDQTASMELFFHFFYFHMGLNCPKEVLTQISFFFENTPLRDHCEALYISCTSRKYKTIKRQF